MIDVPVEVKDALREGTYKKNYRFVVTYDEWVDAGSFTTIRYSPLSNAGQGEKYIIKDNRKYRFVIDDANFNGYTFYYRNNNYGSWSTLSPIDRNTWELTGTGWNEIEISDYNGTVSYHSQVIVTKYIDTFTIDNDNLVSESVSIDERMCSGDTLKFGLCEGSSLEFQYFDKPNITGKRVQAFVDVDYGADEPYTIPMGFFDVKKCSRQASTGIIKATCYNKLQSEYLDAKANILIEGIQSDTSDANQITLKTIQDLLLQDYEIKYKETTTVMGGIGQTISDLRNTPTFKVNGRSTTYYPFITTQYLYFHTDPTKRCKIDFASYLTKLKACIADFKSKIMGDLQNASTFWGNFLNSDLYQIDCSVIVIYGNGSTINGFFCLEDEAPSSKYASSIINYGVLEKLEYLYGVSTIGFRFPIEFGGSTSSSSYQNFFTEWATAERISLDDMVVEEVATDSIEAIELSRTDLPDVTLRELVGANYELHCQFGQLSRVTDLFSGVELNHSRLYPADSLYPATDLYPSGAVASGFRSMYSKLWADEGNVHKWRYLIITYKGLDGDGNETDYTLQRTVNNDGTDNYNCSDNWLFRNLVWTAEQIGEYADAMVAKMRDITWFPFEMWCAGLPYLETGDEIEIPLNGESYTSYVLQRQLKGIQNLQDTYINGTLDIF